MVKEPGPPIRIEEVRRIYQDESRQVAALQEVNRSIGRGRLVALRGRSGSGKTILLNCIGGLDRPTSGCNWLEGREVEQLSEGEVTALPAEAGPLQRGASRATQGVTTHVSARPPRPGGEDIARGIDISIENQAALRTGMRTHIQALGYETAATAARLRRVGRFDRDDLDSGLDSLVAEQFTEQPQTHIAGRVGEGVPAGPLPFWSMNARDSSSSTIVP
jgi:energy-coupling factor transporter ATP-binding protein EcfA2